MSKLFLQKKSYFVKTKVNLSNWFVILIAERYLWHKSRKAGESIKYGDFVVHIFDGEECRVYDDNKLIMFKRKQF